MANNNHNPATNKQGKDTEFIDNNQTDIFSMLPPQTTVHIPVGTNLDSVASEPPATTAPQQTVNIPVGTNLDDVQPAAAKPPPSKKKMIVLSEDEQDPKLEKLLRHLSKFDIRINIVSNVIEWTETGGTVFEELNENDLLLSLRKAGMKNIKDDLMTFIGSSEVQKHDPFKYYFEGLKQWNGTTDHILNLSSFIKSEEQDFFNTMFKKHLIRCVACALEPSVFNKHCLTLIGKQNDGKSTFVRFLSPPTLKSYFKDGIRFDNKDADIALTENLIINLDELATFTKSDINRIKEVFSKETVKARRPFAKREITMARRATFFASTNDDEFLTDVTGNVRWLVFKIDSINHDNGGINGYQSININDVWAQAYSLYSQGEKYQLTKEEIERSEQRNKAHMISTAEMEGLREFFKHGESGEDFMTGTQILNALQTKTTAKISHKLLGQALKHIGFKAVTKRIEDKNFPVKGYLIKTN